VSTPAELGSHRALAAPVRLRLPLELALSSLLAAVLAWALLSVGPVGPDFAAHAYGRLVFLRHGFVLWDNFWYAGRYTFVTYSLLYYPLAAAVGIRALAVATVALAVLGFALVLNRQWGWTVRWSSRSFAVMWSGILLSAVFPFALGAAFGLFALAAIQGGYRARFAALAALTLAASPLAFLLLLLILGGAALGSNISRRNLAGPALAVLALLALECLLWLLFPAAGTFPFRISDLLGAVGFACLGAALTKTVPRSRPLYWFFLIYGTVCVGAYLLPTELGANVIRLRFAAFPLALLVLALRNWRPLPVAVTVAALAFAWNTAPLLRGVLASHGDPEANAAYWRPAIDFLHSHANRSFRVEAVDTTLHSPALYLASAGIPLARGWFRQDDFPVNKILYRTDLAPTGYLHWLRELGVDYVVLSTAPPDYSSRVESALLRSSRSGLTAVFHNSHLTIFRVPHPQPIVVGPAPARMLAFTAERIDLSLSRPGWYRIAVRYSPYWHTSNGCLKKSRNGMLELDAFRAHRVSIAFEVNGKSLLSALAETTGNCSAAPKLTSQSR
jgi:hypothetical protein